jgi:AcrR family transcriptional regulator
MTAAPSAARERVQAVAERLFAERGYKAVTLRDIAQELGIRQASLYYHFPGGKEELYVTVTRHALERHREGIEQAIRSGGDSLAGQLRAVAEWLLQHPPLDLVRMVQADMPAISAEHSKELLQLARDALLRPLENLFAEARARGETKRSDDRLLAALFLSMADGIQVGGRFAESEARAYLDEALDTFLHGVLSR